MSTRPLAERVSVEETEALADAADERSGSAVGERAATDCIPPWPVSIPDRRYLRIGEVASLLGLKPHVLRYWETEFKQLRPAKSRQGQRLYRRSDVELLILIQDLLHIERYTIAGARERLDELVGGKFRRQVKLATRIERLESLRDCLEGLIRVLDRREKDLRG